MFIDIIQGIFVMNVKICTLIIFLHIQRLLSLYKLTFRTPGDNGRFAVVAVLKVLSVVLPVIHYTLKICNKTVTVTVEQGRVNMRNTKRSLNTLFNDINYIIIVLQSIVWECWQLTKLVFH